MFTKKVEMLKLMRKAMSTMLVLKNKKIIKQLNVVRKQLGLELKEDAKRIPRKLGQKSRFR